MHEDLKFDKFLPFSSGDKFDGDKFDDVKRLQTSLNSESDFFRNAKLRFVTGTDRPSIDLLPSEEIVVTVATVLDEVPATGKTFSISAQYQVTALLFNKLTLLSL